MNCIMCGKRIGAKAIEGADYLKDTEDNLYCITCAKQCLTRWQDFERIEKLAEEPDRYRTALIDTLKWSINEGYCVRPKEYCQASMDKCLKCWLNYLVREEMEG